MKEVSLSVRRAWIEIPMARCQALAIMVALRKESVDRNARPLRAAENQNASLSVRRAWIEIDAIAVQAVNSSGRSP